MFTESKVIEIFCLTDNFCKFFDSLLDRYAIKYTTSKVQNTPVGVQDVACCIFIHELGHYFGLRHVFINSDSTLIDDCNDTPHYDRKVYNAWIMSHRDDEWYEKVKRTVDDGTVFISTNIEDYMDEITPD